MRGDPAAAFQPGARRSLVTERPDLPDAFVKVVERAINPQKRFATAGELFTALSDAAGLGGTLSESALTPAPSRRGRFRIWILAAVIAAVALLLLMTPVRNLLLQHTPIKTAAGGAQNDFLQAQDLLDHYYKPNNLEKAVALFQKATGEDAKFAPGYAGLWPRLLVPVSLRRTSISSLVGDQDVLQFWKFAAQVPNGAAIQPLRGYQDLRIAALQALPDRLGAESREQTAGRAARPGWFADEALGMSAERGIQDDLSAAWP